MRYGLKNQSIR